MTTYQSISPTYDTIGCGYATRRRPDPRIAALIDTALDGCATIVNIGAGTGSYEIAGRTTLAVEPSAVMIAQRAPDAAPCRQGVAEDLPVDTQSFDAATAYLTLHHWSDVDRGLAELARVARRIVILTWVPDSPGFWLTDDYFPAIRALDDGVFPTSAALVAQCRAVAADVRLLPVPIPHDCIDGFLAAYWARPEAYLDADVRRSISRFAIIDPTEGLARLRDDLADGAWDDRYRALRAERSRDLGYRLVVCDLAPG
ncbi:class I SAM-dependent methyltransferase [Sphingomonas oligophenolica]|uniref:Class I SAM-dependent methyltransferase n=1 Tax=Sphingomonas oligophenolica TaxID=301154 RepID=A0A502CGK2_9SPHN|nr:class I SAM-dependent methyltransferase [Sphingomonas oligophenolica]TPG12287.1 class I SAM-dependent methyltransferase [Sphingomonas oligophenolica]